MVKTIVSCIYAGYIDISTNTISEQKKMPDHLALTKLSEQSIDMGPPRITASDYYSFFFW